MSKVINLAERRAQRQARQREEVISGHIIWLHCPTCKTTEYTEVQIPGGRIHNKCGTLVEEKPVPIDIRAEYTIAMRNLTILEEWAKKGHIPRLLSRLLGPARQMLQQIENAEREYQRRLEAIVYPKKLTPYTDEWNPQGQNMNVKIIQPFGILLTAARQPDLYFPANESE